MGITSRDRVVTALQHREPDRAPISFGGLHDSIHLYGHRALKKHLRLEGGEDIIQDPFQQIVFPDARLLDLFRSDIVPVFAKPAAGFSSVISIPLCDNYNRNVRLSLGL